MELFDSMDSSLAEFLGVNEYELLSKQAKVSFNYNDLLHSMTAWRSDIISFLLSNYQLPIKSHRNGSSFAILIFRHERILSEILDYQIITKSETCLLVTTMASSDSLNKTKMAFDQI